mgnify:CR=1 FL=1
MEQVKTHSHTQSHSFEDFEGGYNPHSGFYFSRTILDADYDADIKKLQDQMINLQCNPDYMRHLEDRNTDEIFKIISFKSADGTNDTQSAPPEPEIPSNFSYTPAYYDSPSIRKAIDWFQCEKARVRIFRQQPGQNLQLHHDFDNERHSYNKDHTMVRILMPLNDERDSYVNLANANCDAMVKLEKGQFAIINTDYVWHGTVTYDKRPRDMLNMIVKWNDWLHDLTRPKSHVAIERITL